MGRREEDRMGKVRGWSAVVVLGVTVGSLSALAAGPTAEAPKPAAPKPAARRRRRWQSCPMRAK